MEASAEGLFSKDSADGIVNAALMDHVLRTWRASTTPDVRLRQLALIRAVFDEEERAIGVELYGAPCRDCESYLVPRSPCPLCGVVICQVCAEAEGASCCDAADQGGA